MTVGEEIRPVKVNLSRHLSLTAIIVCVLRLASHTGVQLIASEYLIGSSYLFFSRGSESLRDQIRHFCIDSEYFHKANVSSSRLSMIILVGWDS